MDLRKLRYFVSICDSGSLSKASAKLSVAQSALSKHLADLEEELGAELAERSPGGVTPTPIGLILLEHARTILLQVERAKAAVRGHRNVLQSVVKVGLPESVSPALGLSLLHAAQDRCPDIALRLHESNCGALKTQLTDGHIDLAILFTDRPLPGIRATTLARANLYLVSSRTRKRKHTPGGATMAAALASPLILAGAEDGIRRCIEARASEAGLSIRNLVTEIDSLTLIKGAVLENMAMTILPASAVQAEVAQGQLMGREIVKPRMTCTVALCCAADSPPRPAVECVATLIASVCAELLASGRWPGADAPTGDAA